MYNKYPYTDFSELNLDWFLSEFKQLKEEWETTSGQWDQMQLNFQTLEGTVQTFTTFVENYFENLDVQQEINNKLDALVADGTLSTLLAPLVDDKLPAVVTDQLPAEVTTQLSGVVQTQLPGVVSNQIGAAVAPEIPAAVTDWLEDNVDPVGSAVMIDTTLSIAGAAADAKVAGDDIRELQGKFTNQNNIKKYLHTSGAYINDSGVETSITGVSTYRIPIAAGQLVMIEWPGLAGNPWDSIQEIYFCKMFKSDNTFERIRIYTYANIYGSIDPTNKKCIVLGCTDAAYIGLSIPDLDIDYIDVYIDVPYPETEADNKISTTSVPFHVNDNTTFRSQFYFDAITTTIKLLGSTAKSNSFEVKQGDVVHFGALKTGLSYRAGIVFPDGTGQTIGTSANIKYDYVVPNDGIMFIYNTSDPDDAIYEPINNTMVTGSNVYGMPESKAYNGLSGVAFGTSLTYRAIPNDGYMDHLPGLSGITFDNQGVGSSYIYGESGALNMLDTIKAYAGYAGKDVVTIEGFVNDWYYQNTLGDYKDLTENSVCGCVRSAINHIRSQNPDVTVYLILDHYGQNYSGLDCSSTSIRGSHTQYSYYEEIAKTAESMGVRVIRLYAISEMGEATPQYFNDNIHPNTKGAVQTANTIWSIMSKYKPNVK